ncbi:hypothetical protein M378DRAFT_14096 [Amanita muscaria Koide BX008]|uniref:Uncharacterized protein n=1 Tax=Amanita muscaria (strain Koide BX008) TaxID=946122 RepID=A0A0C2WUT2_AMAMK|nr:hypothetical protein M378DRAFT_14096 [Amanita muscaria Koide BX008]
MFCPTSDEEQRTIKRRQVRMLKAIGHIYLAAYRSGNQKEFLESLHYAWFSLFPPANCQQPYIYSPDSVRSDKEYEDIKRVCKRVNRDIEWVRYTLMRIPADKVKDYVVPDYISTIVVIFLGVGYCEGIESIGSRPRRKVSLVKPFTPHRN